jgi:phospholipase C
MTKNMTTEPNIKNVFVLMLENHSFDNIFAMSGIPDINAATCSEKSVEWRGRSRASQDSRELQEHQNEKQSPGLH